MMGRSGNRGDREDRRDNRRREEFVQGVLGRTSGSPCERAAGLLPALADGELGGTDRQLVQAHLEHCPGCRNLAVTLGWLGPLLPEMAILDPGPAFTEMVLNRTTRAGKGFAGVPTAWDAARGPGGLMDRLGRWWQERILRPGFAMQVAYVATVLLVLLVATPGSPLRGTPGRALEVIQAGPMGMPLVGPVVEESSRWVGNRTRSAVGAARGEVSRRWNGTKDSLSSRAGRTADERRMLGWQLQDIAADLRRGRLGAAGYGLVQALHTTRLLWQDWWNEETIGTTEIERSTP